MSINIEGAKEHNLQDIDVQIGDGLTAVTGVSGSGKTSLVFDTLYHEARRRFQEVYSIGTAAQRLSPAQVDRITGLGPAVAVGQNLLNRNPNSTLASATGILPFLRIFYTRYGKRACPNCGHESVIRTQDEIVDHLLNKAGQGSVSLWVSLMRGVRGSHSTLLRYLVQEFGKGALQVDNQVYVQGYALDPAQPHDFSVRIGVYGPDLTPVEVRAALRRVRALGSRLLLVQFGPETETMSLGSVCAGCGHRIAELQPTHFNRSCSHCDGAGCERCFQTGLFPAAAAVRWQNLSLPALLSRSVEDAEVLLKRAQDGRLRSEILRRLEALLQVGLGYLTLNRSSPSLSRGEAQRSRLAVTLTSKLEDMLHIFDEPTIGQHPADTKRFLPVLRALPGPVVYVEHDRDATAFADRVIDLGPGAGAQGGRVIFSGSPAELWHADTPSGRFFSGRQHLPIPDARAEAHEFLEVRGAFQHNLRNIDVRFPVGRLTAVTGVSGSGKSTLTEDVLAASLNATEAIGCQSIVGDLLKPVLVDQSPIGRNPRSNPATYTQLSSIMRDLFAGATGLSASYFSFNRSEGACASCDGLGAVEIKMRYLPSTWIPCSVCDGLRFNEEVLAARIDFDDQLLSIADIYRMAVSDISSLIASTPSLPFAKRRSAQRVLQALVDVGLGYLALGQPSPTLSGGEAQRVKLAKFLGRRTLSRSLLILDEPTTGLHPHDVSRLLHILQRLVETGGTVIMVEHNLDVVRAADWIIDLGPGAGPSGGSVLYEGPAAGLGEVTNSPTAQALNEDRYTAVLPKGLTENSPLRSAEIIVKNATIHNLQGVDVAFPKRALTVVTGVSGSGKSSLVKDVLEAEARRRFLESLSLYERQGTREGDGANVDSVTGLGVAIGIGHQTNRRLQDQRATVGIATEISRHLAALLTWAGDCHCHTCGKQMKRETVRDFVGWLCAECRQQILAKPRLFSPNTYAAACQTCNGIGTLQIPNPAKLIIHPEKPLCDGAMYSPGFFPKGYLCKPLNHGYDMVRALAQRYNFDPEKTPWNEMSTSAQNAFLFGDEEPLHVTFRSRIRSDDREFLFPGFYGFIRDWDVGGTYTNTKPCPSCNGAKLRPEYLAVTLAGYNVHQLSSISLAELSEILGNVQLPKTDSPQAKLAQSALEMVSRRLLFLLRVGLGYLHLDRLTATLSAGEAQRIKLAGLLGSGLTSLTLLLDEPTRGLHSAEVDALKEALFDLRDEGNTVIVVEHDPLLMKAADHLIDIGPGAGTAGGRIVGQGTLEEIIAQDSPTGRWLRSTYYPEPQKPHRQPYNWLVIEGARANNLQGDEVRLPLGTLIGICGVSGSGKSTLLIDTLGRYLAPKKQTTSVAYEPLEPGEFDSIIGEPQRTLILSQARAGITSPLAFLGLEQPLRKLFAMTAQAFALGLTNDNFRRNCSACKGRGLLSFDMDFLPAVHEPCETCRGTGFLPEAWQVKWRDISLPDLIALTIDEVFTIVKDQLPLARNLEAAREVGLGYLVLRQPGFALSGGEVQRLRIAKELARKTKSQTLYILDEPTVGLHLDDVHNLLEILNRLVDRGHTVIVIEHHTSLLAACDWLLEFGPGGGPDGGRLIASGPPQMLAQGQTPTAPYLREALSLGEEIES